MAETTQGTVVESIADNIAASFFEGSASSKNIITPNEPAKPEGNQDGKEGADDKPAKIIGGFQPEPKLSAAELIEDMLEKPDEPIVDQVTKTTVEPTKETEVETDFGFLVEDGVLAGFEDDSPIKTKEDLVNLIKGNKEAWIQDAETKAVERIREDLPEEVKFILDYAKKGGSDFQSIFKLLSQAQELQSYSTETVDDQRSLVRAYYKTQGWTEDEIEEELISLVERDHLKSHAEKIKPKLDRMTQEELAKKQEQQDLLAEQAKKARQYFTHNVVETLKKGKIGAIALNKKEQADIYSALVEEQYDSISGRTNRLGALLDRIQYVEPNYELLAEVTMLLSDPTEYKKKILDQANTQVAADQVKKIKIEQNKAKINSGHNPVKDTKKLPKLSPHFINPFE